MRKEFLAGVKTSRAAKKLALWACRVIKADGGYWAFESNDDAYRWVSQK